MKAQRRGKLAKSRPVESSEEESTSDEKSDDDRPTLGSKLNLLRDRRKRSRRKTDQPDNPAQQGIAQSLKRTFGFFRKSERSNEDVETAVVIESANTPASAGKKTMDVVVDVHAEHEEQKARVVAEANASDDQRSNNSSAEHQSNQIDLIEQMKTGDEERPKSDFVDTETEESDLQEEVELTSEIPPTSGGRRKRWDKPEISTGNLVEDLAKPKRRQWAKGAASAEIRKVSGKKIVVPKRSSTTEPCKLVPPPKPSRLPKPIAAPRTKNAKKEDIVRGFDNDALSSDHDEILRIETVSNHSPRIKISSVSSEKIEKPSILSEEVEKIPIEKKESIEEIKEYIQDTAENTETSATKDPSVSGTPNSREFMQRKTLIRRRSSDKRKSSSDKRSEDEEEEEEELETVLDAMDKRSRSSGSSKVEIIPSRFFDRGESSDETTISTNEEMHSPGREVPRPKSRSRSKSKSSRYEKSDEKDSERSSRTKRKTPSARNSPGELSTSRRRLKSRTKKRRIKKDKHKLEEVEEEIKYTSIMIHRSDMLEADYITRHPMVKVHIVYADDGDYLKVKNKDDDAATNLQPIISAKFDFKEKKSMVPVWEEQLIFKMDFNEILCDGKGSVVVLFEIVDLLSFNEANLHYHQFGKESCWYKVAWAFLRPIGVNGTQHVNKIVRLQLYRPKKTFRRASKTKCDVYKWWKSGSRDKYPSSLYVSISPIDPPKLEPVFSEQLLQLHDLSEVHSDSQNLHPVGKSEEVPEPPKWTRHAAQSCQIPNETYFETEAGDSGCFYVVFSNDGKYLACALSDDYDYPILVYKIDEMKIHVRFAGHKNFIYSLSWSHDDHFLLSVSSDQTARFWDVKEQIIEDVQSLPHPSYVYCGKFSPETSNFVLTGCYDHVARIWAYQRSHSYELVQELEGHNGFVSSVCIHSRDEVILTGDGLGVIIIWTAKKSRRSLLKREWQLTRKVKIKELDGIPINTILVHPLGSRLLVHSRNSELTLLDVISGAMIKKFEGLKNNRIQITSCLSPCGSLLFCGGENSMLNVWSTDSGKLMATYEINSHERAITCVDYHPYDHVLAFAVYGAPIPAKVLKYDRDVDGVKVGLKLLAMTTNMMSVSSSARFGKDPETIVRNGVRNFELSAMSLMHPSTIVSIDHLPSEFKDEDEARKNLRGKLQRFMESGPNLKVKSLTRLNGIIEKIDRILMYATSQKSQDLDVESARNSVFTVEEKHPRSRMEMFELQELPVENVQKKRKKKHRQRSRSARNALSPTPNDFEFSKAFSDSAAFTRKVSKFSDDSSTSNRSVVRGNFTAERLDLKDIGYNDTESGFKDSLDTIVDGKEEYPSEEVLEDVESLKSDDTYIVKKSSDGSDRSNATFIIESELPVPMSRKKIGRIQVT
ncbi:uncharacterized protein LOC131664986 [Phymastichus coffea]|uniref:uncharacterized protein LOC131664986 n=1 Tax=Phymastichus coffea TaxID=108790 RepID=UPI00273ABF48|nr:uncharacterized protein LOC131664986 [Phymastichus coffea]